MKENIVLLDSLIIAGCKGGFCPSKNDFNGLMHAWHSFFSLEQNELKESLKNDQFWGVTYNLDQSDFAIIAGCLVTTANIESKKLSVFETNTQPFIQCEHRGNPQTMGDTIKDMYEWIAASEHELSDYYYLEMYDTRCNPEEPDSYVVDLFFPIK
ncbi:GyrI-like domain-containing protein [Vibrio sp. DW001]|uniref:GyrI-like domain-containing protein n=1 Tax=Vibrio sp. DW001 TaxID=2912315 RepID=UPI0023AEE4D3|nr:GyrI-like domain-containing protein [Vibrio sp. DW001]WED28245.1 GyrI-like domain-containing protein [Vibrio sp. DW001]